MNSRRSPLNFQKTGSDEVSAVSIILTLVQKNSGTTHVKWRADPRSVWTNESVALYWLARSPHCSRPPVYLGTELIIFALYLYLPRGISLVTFGPHFIPFVAALFRIVALRVPSLTL